MHRPHLPDRGSVLPIVLVVVVVLGAVVVATATYATSTLKFGQVVEGRADRLSAAEGGMRDIIDRIDNGQLPLCSTAAGVGGTTINIPDISGASVAVTCKQISSTLTDTAGWSVAVTGEVAGIAYGKGLITPTALTAEFGGRVYIANTDLLSLKKDLQINQGDLFYTDNSCSEGGNFVSAGYTDPDPGMSGQVIFDSSIRGLWCTSRPWQATVAQPDGLFGEPAIPTLPTAPPTPPDFISGCTVFYPGLYTVEPVWTSNNYMMSGDYVFDIAGDGEIKIDHAAVTAGREGVDADDQAITNTPCDDVRDADDPDGASFYLKGSTHFVVAANGSLEIMRREQGVDRVSVQTLSSHSLTYSTPVLSSASGNNKQMAIHGLIWAPHTLIELGEVTNSVIAQINGGAVIGALDVAASASAIGLLIGVEGTPASDQWGLTSVATTGDGISTAVRVIADVRQSSTNGSQTVWEIATNSWRVCEQGGC